MSMSQEDDGNMREKLVSILQIQHHSKHPKTKFTKKFPIFLHSRASTTCKVREKKATVSPSCLLYHHRKLIFTGVFKNKLADEDC